MPNPQWFPPEYFPMAPSLPLSQWESTCATELREATAGLERDSTIEETIDWLPLTDSAAGLYNSLAPEAPPSSLESATTLRGEFNPAAFALDPDEPAPTTMEPTVALFLDRLLESR